MKARLLLGACFVLGAFASAALVACGLGVSGLEPSGSDASASDVGAPDTTTGDTGTRDSGSGDSAVADAGEDVATEASCMTITCNGSCLAASDCRSCTGAPLLCAASRRCVSGCEGCADQSDAAMPIECFACDNTHANPIGTCQYDDASSYCLNGDYAGQYGGQSGYLCGCTDAGAASCPGATQVCAPLGGSGATFCLTCGEATLATVQGLPCKGGGACQPNTAACQ